MTRSNNHSHHPGERAVSHAFGPSALRLLVAAIQIGSLGLAANGMAHAQPVVPAAAGQSQQQQAMYELDIPAQPLASAIAQFSSQTGADLFSDGVGLGGLSSNGVVGRYTLAEGLQQLLVGTGLSFHYQAQSSNGRPTVQLMAQGQALQLAPISVSGEHQATTEGDWVYRTAGSATHISAEKIERFRGTSVGDFLSGTPGLINADNSNGAALDVNIRGMQGNNRVPVIIDGAQQQVSVYRGYAGRVDRSYVDPDLISSVTVEKGPSAAADGVGAIGGVVRMSTIGVKDVLLPDENYGVRLKGGFNTNSSSPPSTDTRGGIANGVFAPGETVMQTYDRGMDRPGFAEATGFSGSIAAAFRSEHIDLLAAYARRKNGNYHAGGRGGGAPVPKVYEDCRVVSGERCLSQAPGYNYVSPDGLGSFRHKEEVLNTSQDNQSWLLKSTIRLAHDQKLDLGYAYYHSEYGEIMPSQIGYSGSPYQASLRRAMLNTWTSRYNWNPAANDLVDLNVGYWMTDSVQEDSLQFYGWQPDNGRDDVLNKRWGVNIDNTSLFDTAWGGVSLNYGGSYTYETVKPADDSTYAPSGLRGNRREYSLFTAAEWQPINWLTLAAAIRYTDFKLNDEKRHIQVYEQHTDSGLAPVLSVTVEPWSGIQLYARYGEALRMPSMFEGGVFSGDSPEHAKTWEFGFNALRRAVFFDNDQLGVQVSYFDNNVEDYITRTDTPEGRAQVVNIDRARLKGWELAASYDMGRVFSELAYTHYTDTEFCVRPDQVRQGSRLQGLCYAGGVTNSYVVNHIPPKDSLSLTLGARAFNEKLTLGGRFTHMGSRPVSGMDGGTSGTGGTIAHTEWSAYNLLDLFASYEHSESLSFDLAVDNVRDVFYIDALGMAPRPAPGRTLRGGATFKF